MKRKQITYFIVIFFAAWCVAMLQSHVLGYAGDASKEQYSADQITETEGFRALRINVSWLEAIEKFAKHHELDKEEVLTFYMLDNELSLADKKISLYDMPLYVEKAVALKESRPDEWEKVLAAYKAVFSDVKYFPIPESSTEYPINISFSDGWERERYYEDVMHLHEGTDIMAAHERGYVPVVSMTDGVVENVGWLELGGYRIGIRSENGGYFYYAHLYKYSKNFKIGDTVKAGELIGFMGDSGYGQTEGTVGNFAVHLHMGIYIKTKNYEEISINPFPVLSHASKKRILYNMQGK